MRIEDSTYQDSEVPLDGHEYVRCRFLRCRLVYSGGPLPTLLGNHIDDSRFVLAGPAALTAGLLRAIFSMGGVEMLAETIGLQARALDPASLQRTPGRTDH